MEKQTTKVVHEQSCREGVSNYLVEEIKAKDAEIESFGRFLPRFELNVQRRNSLLQRTSSTSNKYSPMSGKTVPFNGRKLSRRRSRL
jgi:hypothetical protein